jgi:SAM-dependent methyltransferase
MNETSKTKEIWGQLEKSILTGHGIDIGCGPDPVCSSARKFDIEDGDANDILQFVDDKFDFVYSSHCLEHMNDPVKALQGWWALVKPGGHLILIVPDEDIYEQGVFPSRFNGDHKSTFTISKAKSWSPKSFNILDLILQLPQSQLITIALQDHNYDRRLQYKGIDKPSCLTRLLVSGYAIFTKITSIRIQCMDIVGSNFIAVDQTHRPDVLAQIQCILKKNK